MRYPAGPYQAVMERGSDDICEHPSLYGTIVCPTYSVGARLGSFEVVQEHFRMVFAHRLALLSVLSSSTALSQRDTRDMRQQGDASYDRRPVAWGIHPAGGHLCFRPRDRIRPYWGRARRGRRPTTLQPMCEGMV